MTGIPLGTYMSNEHDRGAGGVTENDRRNIEISKNRVDEANLFYFRPDDICHAMEGGFNDEAACRVEKLHIPR